MFPKMVQPFAHALTLSNIFQHCIWATACTVHPLLGNGSQMMFTCTWNNSFILSKGADAVLATAPATPPAINILHNRDLHLSDLAPTDPISSTSCTWSSFFEERTQCPGNAHLSIWQHLMLMLHCSFCFLPWMWSLPSSPWVVKLLSQDSHQTWRLICHLAQVAQEGMFPVVFALKMMYKRIVSRLTLSLGRWELEYIPTLTGKYPPEEWVNPWITKTLNVTGKKTNVYPLLYVSIKSEEQSAYWTNH